MNVRDLAALLADGGPVKPSNGQWLVQCPAHDDTTPSLSVGDGTSGPVMKCFAGCDNNDILAARGLTWAEVLGDPDRPDLVTRSDFTEVVYTYRDEDEKILFEVVRGSGKRFRQRTPDISQPSGYRWNLRGTRRVLYRLPQVRAAIDRGEEIWVTEGEKDADVICRQGACGTTNPMGAGKWRDEYTHALEGASVTIWADADEPGRKHAREVRDALLPVAHRVRIVESPIAKDAYAHIVKRQGLDAVVETVPYETEDTEAAFLIAEEYIDQEYPQGDWAIRTLMREREVMVLTGFEGHGKSAMLKQMAVATACGVHPFNTAATLEPKRVLYIDAENQVPDCIEDFTRLRQAARADGVWFPGAPLFIGNTSGVNLATPAGVAWLVERVTMHQPDLLVMGPVYNLVDVVSKDEEMVRALMRAITAVHQVASCAVLIEHHSPHEHVDGERVVRPIGTTMMMRWPSFGFGLKPLHPNRPNVSEPFEFVAWRGGRRRGRTWPRFVTQADGWFWEEAEPPV